MKQFSTNMFLRTVELHKEVVTATAEMRDGLISEPLTTLVDHAYSIRETLKHLKAMQSILQEEQRVLAKTVAVMYVVQGNFDRVQTDYCSAKPDIKLRSKVLTRKKEQDQYDELMTFFGVKEEFIAWDFIRVAWNEFGDWLYENNKVGNAMPPGLSDEHVYEDTVLSILKKQPVAPVSVMDDLENTIMAAFPEETSDGKETT